MLRHSAIERARRYWSSCPFGQCLGMKSEGRRRDGWRWTDSRRARPAQSENPARLKQADHRHPRRCAGRSSTGSNDAVPFAEPVDRFLLAVEQLRLCRELLLDRNPAKARMAVILLDGLADAFLYRRLERLYSASENDFLGDMRFPKEVRRQARLDFGTRLRLCADVTYDAFVSGGGGPLVTDDAAVVLRVGHSYRNAAYHRDRHNPATIGAVGRLFFTAVADLFVRSQHAGHTTGGFPDPQVERLRELGVPMPGNSVTWRDASVELARELNAGLEVAHADLVALLADDLNERADAVEELVVEVPGGPDDFDSLMASLEFQDVHGADEELLDLRELRDPVRRSVVRNIPLTQELRDEGADADRRYQERLAKLGRNWRARASMRTLDEARAIAEQLVQEDDPRRVLTTYQEIDGKLDILEDYSAKAVADIDRYIDMQVEAMRER